MILTNTLHPPAGANPILIIMIKAKWSFLLSPILLGVAILLITGLVYHRIHGIKYPSRRF